MNLHRKRKLPLTKKNQLHLAMTRHLFPILTPGRLLLTNRFLNQLNLLLQIDWQLKIIQMIQNHWKIQKLIQTIQNHWKIQKLVMAMAMTIHLFPILQKFQYLNKQTGGGTQKLLLLCIKDTMKTRTKGKQGSLLGQESFK